MLMELEVMTFNEVVTECAMNTHFVDGFNRLTNSHISFKDKRSSIEIMIDEATGNHNIFDNNSREMQCFISFVFEVAWLPLVRV